MKVDEKKAINSNEKEIEQYLNVLEKHDNILIHLKGKKDKINIDKESLDKILEKIDEYDSFTIGYIVFSSTKKFKDSEVWGIRRKDKKKNDVVQKNEFFDSLLKPSTPIKEPPIMKKEEFSKFENYFNSISK